VIDEAALARDLGRTWQMVIRPTLADLRGDAWLLSTPRGRDFFWECFQRGQRAGGEWKSWHMPTSSNPHIDPAEIEAARADLPERVFQQEFLAHFLDQSGGVFRRVREAATATPQDAALPQHSYVMGVDFARQADYTCLAVIDTTTSELVALDRFNQVDYQVQLGRLQALAERFEPAVIVAEQNSIGLPLIEQLQRAGLPISPFVTSNASKTRIIDALALAFEQGSLRILNEPVLLDELQAFELERLPSGMVRYSAPPGKHDDTVMSLALAWSACQQPGSLLLWS
jgi:phage FluMu gp28-like protein